VAPVDPHMLASVAPRSGQDPLTGVALAPPGSPPGADAINGHERTAAGDLQYACVSDLPAARDCSDPAAGPCDCADPANDSPLCAPGKGGGSTLQVRAKAYPALRQLAVLKGLGDRGSVGSICAPQLGTPGAADFGFRGALEPLRARLHVALGGQCLPRALPTDANGQVACRVLEARVGSGAACACDPAAGRAELGADRAAFLAAASADPPQEAFTCACEIRQLLGPALTSCQQETSSAFGQSSGFCYLDAATAPPTGDPELLKHCPIGEQHMLRFVGEGAPLPNGTAFIVCAGD